jgi:hypothetical protein
MALTDVLLLSAAVRRTSPVDALRITLPVFVVATVAGTAGWLTAEAIGATVAGALGAAVVAEVLLVALLGIVRSGSLRDLAGVGARALSPRLSPLWRAG